MKNRCLLIVWLMSLVISAGCLFAQTHNVPADYSTIQQAINASDNGDTILVSQGRYYENINFRGKSLVVASHYMITHDTADIRQTIIDGSTPVHQDTGSCVLLISAEDSLTVLEGFTLTGGTGTPIYGYTEGGGVLMDHSSAEIRNNIITDNHINDGGGGIAAWNGYPKILNNLIMNNTGGYAAGIVLNYSGGVIRNNIIYHNQKLTNNFLTGGLMVWDRGPAPQIVENNTIVGNTSLTYVGGMSIDQGTQPRVRNNIIWANRQRLRGGQCNGTAINDIEYCNLEENLEGEGNISSFPNLQPNSFNPESGSPCIDTGDTSSIYNDIEDGASLGNALYPSAGGLRNDIGAFGGPLAAVLNTFHVDDLFVGFDKVLPYMDPGDTATVILEFLNLGTSDVTIDHVEHTSDATQLGDLEGENLLHMFEHSQMEFVWNPDTVSEIWDTIKVFHTSPNIENPKMMVIHGITRAAQPSESHATETDLNNTLGFFPNPCHSGGTIHIKLSENENQVIMDLCNITGRTIRNLYQGAYLKGEQDIYFDRTGLPNGVYFINLITQEQVTSFKIVLN